MNAMDVGSVAPLPVRRLSTLQRVEVQHELASMGGLVGLRIACDPLAVDRARRALVRVARRIDAWAARLTRFSADSDLSRLNADPSLGPRPVRPTLGSLLIHAVGLGVRTEGHVDISMLDARLAAEVSDEASREERQDPARWSVVGHVRRRTVTRGSGVRFDLDGVAKGWIADRALALLGDYPTAMVDADGDLALRLDRADDWRIAIADPAADGDLVTLRAPIDRLPMSFGIATSGTSVHAWGPAGRRRHHLIDPATGRSADTDVVQATVIAESAGAAEALAKSALIAGADDGLALLERAGAWGAVLLLDDGELVASPDTVEWLA